TFPLTRATRPRYSLYRGDWPPCTLTTVCEVRIPKSVPTPERAADWGFPEALSVIVRAPDRVPAAKGVKVTLTVQLTPAFNVVPQSWVSAKFPVTAIPVIVSAALPVFVRVKV